jgi:3-oxoadipate enol-lactonase
MTAAQENGLQLMSVNGVEHAFRLEGEPDAPVVMLAHGLLADHTMWDRLTRLLLPNCRVLRYDLRGHGRTSVAAQPWAMGQLVEDAVGLLDALGLQKVHFIGSSLGGMIGQQLGAHHGDRLLSLTLANTGAVQPAPAAWDERIAVARAKGTAALADGTLQRWFTPAFALDAPAELQRMRDILSGTAVEGFAGAAQVVRDLAQLDLLPGIRVPTLIVAGAQDLATPPAQSQQLHEAIRGSKLVALEAAHQSAVEQPTHFAAAWSSFIADFPGKAMQS